MTDKAKRVTSATVNAKAQEHYGKDFNQLLQPEQLAVSTALTTMLVKMNFVELKNDLKDSRLDVFFVEETKFGKGYKLVLQDLLKVELFADTTQTDFYPIDPRKPRDAEVIITDRIQCKIRFDMSQVELLEYFTSSEKQAEYINRISESANQTWSVLIQQFIYNCFRDGTDVWTVASPEFITGVTPIITAIKTALANAVTVNFSEGTTDAEKRVAQLTLMAKQVNLKIALAKEKANLTNSAGSVANPFHLKPKLTDLTLIINQEDLIDMNIYVKAGLFNADFLNMPNVNIIEMSHIPLGTFILIDKAFLQISENLNATYAQAINSQTLWQFNAMHNWFYIGTLSYAYGIKVKIEFMAPPVPPTQKIDIVKEWFNGESSIQVELPVRNEKLGTLTTKQIIALLRNKNITQDFSKLDIKRVDIAGFPDLENYTINIEGNNEDTVGDVQVLISNKAKT